MFAAATVCVVLLLGGAGWYAFQSIQKPSSAPSNGDSVARAVSEPPAAPRQTLAPPQVMGAPTSPPVGRSDAAETGSVVVRAEQKGARFYVYDSNDRSLTGASANNPISVFPGNYKVKINGSENQTSVKAGQNAVLETGSVVVRAEQKGARFYVYDSNDRSLTGASANNPISVFPGTYKLRFQGSERIVSVQAGQSAF